MVCLHYSLCGDTLWPLLVCVGPSDGGKALRPEVLKVKKVHGTVQIAAQLHSEIPHLFCDSFCECLSTGWISCICYDHEYIPRAYPESRHRKKSPRNIIKGLAHPKKEYCH